MAEAKVGIIIEAEDRASSTLNAIKGRMDGFSNQVKSFEPAFKTMAVAGTAAFAAISAGVYKSVEAAAEAQKVQAQLGAVLKSTNGIAGVSAEKAIELSKALQRQTSFGDEAILSAENMLLTFTNIKDNVFPEATKTVLDMSVALGQDLKSSSIQLGKALNDPILGVTALRRVGVAFTEQQQEQIKTLVESGKTLEAQKLILKELATEFGGSAAAEAATFTGRLKQVKEQVGDLQEAIGNALLPILSKLLEKVAPIIIKMIEWAERNPKLTMTIIAASGAIALITAGLGMLGLAIPAITAGMAALGTGASVLMAIPMIAAISAIVVAIVYVVSNWKTLSDNLKMIWKGIADYFNGMITSVRENLEYLLSIPQRIAEKIKNTGLGKLLGMTGEVLADMSGKNASVAGMSAQSVPIAVSKSSEIRTPSIGSQFNFQFNGDVNDKDKLMSNISNMFNRQATLYGAAGQ